MVLGAIITFLLWCGVRRLLLLYCSGRMLCSDRYLAVALGIKRCRGGAEPLSSGLMRLLGVLEVAGGRWFGAEHLPGTQNVEADGIVRLGCASVPSVLAIGHPTVSFGRSTTRGPAGGTCFLAFWSWAPPVFCCTID